MNFIERLYYFTCMFKDLIKKIGSLMGERIVVDPTTFNDPVALKTGWAPNKSGGSNFCTHRLAEVGPDRLEFKATAAASLFCAVFMITGLCLAVAFTAGQLAHGMRLFSWEIFGPALIGVLFAVIGGIMLYTGRAPVVFDKRSGFYWKGRSSPQESCNPSDIKECAEMKAIHALQIISERCGSNNGSYLSYELNLVLSDGKRFTAVDHGSYPKLREDAEKLSAFLGKPLWDAIER
jgi:hypothetical protein